ncbi:MAG TPA: polysaccharide deacetylase family protein [Candidatus Angelobacter sp.]
MVKLAAAGMHRTGILRLVQHFSQRFEVIHSNGGLVPALKRVRSPRFVIICYHSVGTGGVPFHSGIDEQVFEQQIRFLRNSYRIVTVDEICRELDEDGRPGQAVALTFDDGYRSVYTKAFPVLRKYGVPATVYLTASAVETGEISWYDRIFAAAMLCPADTIQIEGDAQRRFALTSQESRMRAATEIVKTLRGYSNQARIAACAALDKKAQLPPAETKDRMLTWAQIHEMQKSGIHFGAHTMSHPAVSRLSPSEWEHELVDSKRLLEERLQQQVVHFAFPFGSPADIGKEICSVLPGYGYRSAVSTAWGVNTPDTNRYLLRRIGGEEPSLPLFALRLRSVFLNEQPPSPELQELMGAAQTRE